MIGRHSFHAPANVKGHKVSLVTSLTKLTARFETKHQRKPDYHRVTAADLNHAVNEANAFGHWEASDQLSDTPPALNGVPVIVRGSAEDIARRERQELASEDVGG